MVPPDACEYGLCRGVLELSSKGRGKGGKTGNDLEPQLPPVYNGDKNASLTRSLRTASDAQEQAHGLEVTAGS